MSAPAPLPTAPPSTAPPSTTPPSTAPPSTSVLPTTVTEKVLGKVWVAAVALTTTLVAPLCCSRCAFSASRTAEMIGAISADTSRFGQC